MINDNDNMYLYIYSVFLLIIIFVMTITISLDQKIKNLNSEILKMKYIVTEIYERGVSDGIKINRLQSRDRLIGKYHD